MKINEVEILLGISKANIRFYEKQGLLSPQRNKNGYRDYSEEDIARLKEIIILRKLNIPVQKITDVLDGALPLQEAVEDTICELQKEIQRLNGALALCKTLKEEHAETLDTQRYWQLIQEKERQGFHFQSIVRDYLAFSAPLYDTMGWIPQEIFLHPPQSFKHLVCRLLLFLAAAAFCAAVTGRSFFYEFTDLVILYSRGFLLVSAILIPIYWYSRKKPKKANSIRDLVPTFLIACVPMALFLMVIVLLIKDLL